MLAIAALSVLSSTMLTVRERFRDIASLKASGMTPAQVVSGVLGAVAGLAAVGLAAGVPLGWLVNRQVMLFIGNEVDTPAELTADPSATWVLAMCLLIGAVVVAAALIPARIGGRVSVTEALRYE
jgi:putative ABC transport system permease protein